MNFLVSTLAICSIAALSVNAGNVNSALLRVGENGHAWVAQRLTDFKEDLSKLLNSPEIVEAQRSLFSDALKEVDVLFNKLALVGNGFNDLRNIFYELEDLFLYTTRASRKAYREASVDADDIRISIVERIEASLNALDSMLKNCSADQKSILEEVKAEAKHLSNYGKALTCTDPAILGLQPIKIW